ncbi:MAG: YkgJ family cysteine cluster protein [Myxococcales bacterium]|nr:YkgJ family cysteine cluster protein [Myxococcales bacterium]
MAAPEEELAKLCTSCGFCCDGTLFRAALLRPHELERAKRIGLRVLDDKGFEFPCPQLKERTCQVYEERPHICRSFICKLLARHRDEGGPIELRLRSIERVHELSKQLQPFGFERTRTGDVKFAAEGPDAYLAMELMSELMNLLEENFTRAPHEQAPPADDPGSAG